MSRIRRQALIEAIRLKILMHSIKPGESVPEESLAAELNVSRTPIREALAAIAEIGLVVMEPNKGSRVAPISIETIRSFFEAAGPIYLATYALSAQRRTEADIERLERRTAEFEASLESSDILQHMLDFRVFLVDLARISGNPFLTGATERLIDYHIFLRRGVVATLSPKELTATFRSNFEHCRSISASVRNSDPDAVKVSVQDSLQRSRNFMLNILP